MLSLRLHLWDLCSPDWTWTGKRWTNGNSWLQPVASPALDGQMSYDHHGRVAVVIQERTGTSTRATSPEPVAVADAATVAVQAGSSTGCEYLAILLEPHRVQLTAGPFGTAPVYLARRGDILHGSWYLPELRAFIQRDRLVDRVVARRLTRQPRYSADTLFPGVCRLTERATATFRRSDLAVTYPPAAEHVLRPRQLRPGADVVGALDELLGAIVAESPAADGPVGIELSGGADSANVALTLASRPAGNVTSVGLVLDGPVGQAQQERRGELVGRLGLRDVMIQAPCYPPFAPAGVRGQMVPHDPLTAYYREAFDALRDAVVASGTPVICTGLGGDELCARHPQERMAEPEPVGLPPWLGPAAYAGLAEVDEGLAPVATITLPTLMAQGTHNPAYLAAGIWPVSPLGHPALVRFGEQLPLEWRAGKRILRERLRRAGVPDAVADPSEPETFSDLMQLGLRQHGLAILADMTRESRLVDLGYLDGGALRQAYEEAVTAPRIPSLLCDAISLEVGLQSLDQGGYPA